MYYLLFLSLFFAKILVSCSHDTSICLDEEAFVEVDTNWRLWKFVDVDPMGRYGRYDELLGSRAVKKVYWAFDQEEEIEVAKLWNFTGDECMINRLYLEVRLPGNLKSNIIALYSVWRYEKKNTLNFTTKICTSGNLRKYRKKNKQVTMKSLKKGSRQILKGLDYMHTPHTLEIRKGRDKQTIMKVLSPKVFATTTTCRMEKARKNRNKNEDAVSDSTTRDEKQFKRTRYKRKGVIIDTTDNGDKPLKRGKTDARSKEEDDQDLESKEDKSGYAGHDKGA